MDNLVIVTHVTKAGGESEWLMKDDFEATVITEFFDLIIPGLDLGTLLRPSSLFSQSEEKVSVVHLHFLDHGHLKDSEDNQKNHQGSPNGHVIIGQHLTVWQNIHFPVFVLSLEKFKVISKDTGSNGCNYHEWNKVRRT